MPSFAFAGAINNYHDPIKDPSYYDPSKNTTSATDIKPITDKAGIILGTINVIGIVVAVIVIIIIGIKYMIGSVSEKAEYKKTMIPYLVGALMLASITTIIRLFAGMITDMASAI